MLSPLRDLEGLVTLFRFTDKGELKRYCRDVVIYGGDLAKFILVCQGTPAVPLFHQIHYTDEVPKHLLPDEKWGQTLSANGIGPLTPPAKKVANKVFQLFEERRWLVGHMFYTATLDEWHFIYFDQRDTDRFRPNWKHGPHIHFVNWLWPNLNAQLVWSNFVTKNEVPGRALHVRYDDKPQPKIAEEA